MKQLKLLSAILTFSIVPMPAFAASFTTSGITQIAAPTTSDYPTAKGIQVFEEAKNVTFPGSGIALDGGTIAAGTAVDSFNVYFNTESNTNDWKNATGSITFDGPILGMIWKGNTLAASDSVLGATGTPYAQTGKWRGLESNDVAASGLSDFFVSGDGNTLNLDFSIVSEGFDELRILTASPVSTAAAPEPITMFGAGTALGFGYVFRRKLSKKKKA